MARCRDCTNYVGGCFPHVLDTYVSLANCRIAAIMGFYPSPTLPPLLVYSVSCVFSRDPGCHHGGSRFKIPVLVPSVRLLYTPRRIPPLFSILVPQDDISCLRYVAPATTDFSGHSRVEALRTVQTTETLPTKVSQPKGRCLPPNLPTEVQLQCHHRRW